MIKKIATVIKDNFIWVLIFICLAGFFFLKNNDQKDKVLIPEEEPICDNEEEIVAFDEPRSIVWEATLDGCLVSCYGASFTRISNGERFAGYYPDENGKYNYENNAGLQIPEEFRTGDPIRIYGKWLGIEADHSDTVFEGKCVPFIEIEKIESIGV